MWKALCKRQLLELLCGNNKKRRTKIKKTSPIGMALLILLLVALFSVIFFGYGMMMAEAMYLADVSWLFFAFAGALALLLGLFGSAYLVKGQLYEAKDNELLLAMPIPPITILTVRLLFLWVQTFLLEAVAIVPMWIAYLCYAPLTLANFSGVLLMLLSLPTISLAIACFLARLLSFLMARVKHKSLVAMGGFFTGMVLYFVVCFWMNQFIDELLLNVAAFAERIKAIYPLYILGKAMAGDALAIVVLTVLFFAIAALCIYYLAQNFFKICAGERGVIRNKKEAKIGARRSVFTALLLREVKRLWNIPIYFMNAVLGGVFLLIAGVGLLIEKSSIDEIFAMVPELAMYTPLIALGLLGFFACTATTTTATISLEGKAITILQSMPVPTKMVFLSKLALHMLFLGSSNVFFAIAASIALSVPLLQTMQLLVIAVLLSVFTGILGLLLNLWLPNLNYNTPTQAVKQGAPVLLFMLFGYLLIAAFVLLFIYTPLTVSTFLTVCVLVLTLLVMLAVWWLNKWGLHRFETLSA